MRITRVKMCIAHEVSWSLPLCLFPPPTPETPICRCCLVILLFGLKVTVTRRRRRGVKQRQQQRQRQSHEQSQRPMPIDSRASTPVARIPPTPLGDAPLHRKCLVTSLGTTSGSSSMAWEHCVSAIPLCCFVWWLFQWGYPHFVWDEQGYDFLCCETALLSKSTCACNPSSSSSGFWSWGWSSFVIH